MLRVEVDRKEDAKNESDDEITMETNEGEFCYSGIITPYLFPLWIFLILD